MSVSLEKIPGVASVNLSLKAGTATIQLKPGNTVSLDQVREAVTHNGFNPQQATVTARGEPIVSGGALQLKIMGSNVTYLVTGSRTVQDGLRNLAGKTVIVDAVVPASKDKTHTMLVTTFRAVT